ncbi:hypothetical protein BDN71DRAFT_210610 [Pleurotus eryngii]|uniref:Uncharacterized protein n=1 Tax=Pleurotus eryngii TaxID=5323 RepID=A0A9P6DC94_PLEER|nr:hypothetical protein BDN71DRAFT_210610 [Pleurotus eryngii]
MKRTGVSGFLGQGKSREHTYILRPRAKLMFASMNKLRARTTRKWLRHNHVPALDAASPGSGHRLPYPVGLSQNTLGSCKRRFSLGLSTHLGLASSLVLSSWSPSFGSHSALDALSLLRARNSYCVRRKLRAKPSVVNWVDSHTIGTSLAQTCRTIIDKSSGLDPHDSLSPLQLLKFELGARMKNLENIILATGEKVRPANMERTISEHLDVKEVLAFGDGQLSLGLLVELAAGKAPADLSVPENHEALLGLAPPNSTNSHHRPTAISSATSALTRHYCGFVLAKRCWTLACSYRSMGSSHLCSCSPWLAR